MESGLWDPGAPWVGERAGTRAHLWPAISGQASCPLGTWASPLFYLPTAPVHPGPELPTSGREAQVSGAREAGEGEGPPGVGAGPALLHPAVGGGHSRSGPPPHRPVQRVEVRVWGDVTGPRCGDPGGAQAEGVPVALEAPGARDAGVEKQLQRLREERTCRVCLDRAVAVVFVPCGHLACAECAPSLQLCPICRAPIRSCVRTFLS